MNKPIKIALCLSGEPRSSMFCFPYIYESLINLGSEYKVDVYIHSWKNFRAMPLYNPYKVKIEPHVPEIIRFKLLKDYQSQYLYNHSLMYYGIKECFKLIDQPYDIIIRSRFDLIFESKLVLFPIFKDIIKGKYDIFSLYNNSEKHGHGIDDQVMICNLKGSTILGNYFDRITSNTKEFFDHQLNNSTTGDFVAEQFLGNYLKECDIKVITHPQCDYKLVRHSNAEFNLPFNFLDQ